MYYVYFLKDPNTDLPFYVGKGKGKRAQYHITQNQKGKNTENPYKDHVIRQILSEGRVPIIEYVFWSDLESTAYEHEEELIKKYGRKRFDENGILTNLCDSSRPPHLEYSSSRRQLYRERMLGNTLNTGRKQSEEEKQKRREALIETWASGKRVVTDKMRETSRATHTGKIVSNDTRLKQSESARSAHAWRRGKTNEEIFGPEKAKLIREKKSNNKPPNCKPIVINGINYTSIKEAARKLNISEYKARKLSDNK